MGHGHVTPNPDGSKARCGGPSICSVCALEQARKLSAVSPEPPADSWNDVLREKIAELDLIASWASQVGYGTVRDYCRKAAHELKETIRIREGNAAAYSASLAAH